MRRKYCLGGRRASAASIMACLALLCMPAVSIAADFRDSPAEAADRACSMLTLFPYTTLFRSRKSVV